MSITHTTESLAHQFFAWMFSALIMVSATEMIHASHGTKTGQGHQPAPVESTYARAEGKTEAARMPEEYDVGLKAPAVSGF